MDSGTSPRQLTRWQKKQSSAKMRCWQDKILTFAKDDINMMFLVSQFEIAGEGSVQSVQRGLSNGNNRWVQIQRGVFTYLSIKHWGLILYSYDFQVYQSLFPLGESAKYAHLVFKTIDKDNTGSFFLILKMEGSPSSSLSLSSLVSTLSSHRRDHFRRLHGLPLCHKQRVSEG